MAERHLAALSVLVCVGACQAHSSATIGQVQAVLADPVFHRNSTAIEVISLDTGRVVYRANADKLLVPASTLKLLTAAAALHKFGAEHQFETQVRVMGEVGAVMAGYLYVVGGGDPGFANGDSNATFDAMAQAIADRGIERVEGQIIGTGAVFAAPALGAGWAWDDVAWAYSAPVSGLMVHENSVDVTVIPGGEIGDLAAFELTPPECISAAIEVSTVGTDPSIDSGLSALPNAEGGIALTGAVRLGGPRELDSLAILQPELCAAHLFKDALERAGINIEGGVGVELQAPAEAETVLSKTSAPLRVLLSGMLKESKNLYAEAFGRHLDPAPTGKTFAGAVPALESVLTAAGVPEGTYRLRDASGLSRYNQMSPAAYTKLLRWIWAQPWRDDFMAMLPIAGIDGTLEERMLEGRATGRVRAKTGSMTGIYALAGYVTTLAGEHLAFAMISNGVTQPSNVIRNAQDRILELLVELPRE